MVGEQVYEEVNDSLSIKLELVTNHTGHPVYYRAAIFTPVCKSGECLPVSIIVFWDILGNYMKYEMPEGKILTKNDHGEFTGEDYDKFNTILQNSSSILKDFDISLLYNTLNETVESIDGVTGATPREISQSIVVGAFFTCHTIWHLVYGEIVEIIQENTRKLESDELLLYLLSHEKFNYRHYAIARVAKKSHESKWSFYFCEALGQGNVFIDRHILEVFPDTWLEKKQVQRKLWDLYKVLSYENRCLLADRYNNILLEPDIAVHFPGIANRENQLLKEKLYVLFLRSKISEKDKEKVLEGYLSEEINTISVDLFDVFVDFAKNNKRLLKLVMKKK